MSKVKKSSQNSTMIYDKVFYSTRRATSPTAVYGPFYIKIMGYDSKISIAIKIGLWLMAVVRNVVIYDIGRPIRFITKPTIHKRSFKINLYQQSFINMEFIAIASRRFNFCDLHQSCNSALHKNILNGYFILHYLNNYFIIYPTILNYASEL